MDGEAAHNALERILEDGSAEPMRLPFSLLKEITDCFSDDRKIGSGGFAVVYKGMVGHGIVAVKKLTNTHNLEETKFHKEVECLVKAKHNNIVRFLGFCAETQGEIADHQGKFVMSDTRNWLLCFEYVPNKTLDMYITDASSGLEWGKRFEIIKGICQGLCYLHDKRILHLDLKPTNILLSDHMVPKIADFGLSRCMDDAQTRVITSHLCGSVGYLPLEFFRGEVAFTSDIYSLGVIIVEILTGEKGYPEDESVVESWMNRLVGDTQVEQVRVCIKIGKGCMDLDPKKRPAARHIIYRLDEMSSIDKTGMISPCIQQADRVNDFKRMQDKKQDKTSVGTTCDRNMEPKELSIKLIKKITDGFSVKVAEDSFGVIYKGELDEEKVAVKKLRDTSARSIMQFRNEVMILNMVEHLNIVKLVGYCCQKEDLVRPHRTTGSHDVVEKFICFEYVPHGSLDKHIYGETSELGWDKRFKIIKGICTGLHALHERRRPIVHSDLNPSNILLDVNMEPKIAGFGLSMIFDENQTHERISNSKSTIEYMASEFLQRGHVSVESDIYSLGLTIIEITTGEKNYSEDDIFESDILTNLRQMKIMPYIKGYRQIKGCMELGLSCIAKRRGDRPTSADVIKKVEQMEASLR